MADDVPEEWAFVPNDTPEGRCRFTTSYGDMEFVAGNVTCWRPVWREHDRCIWHALVAEKPAEELADARTANPERLDGAVLRKTEIGETVTLADCSLYGADLIDASLQNTDLTDADLRGVDLNDASLESTTLTHANLVGANLSGANIMGADLAGSNLQGAILTKCSLFGAELTDATLHAANLTEADLSATILTACSLRGADFTGADLQWATFLDADLQNADLVGVNLQKTTFKNADLRGSNLTNATARECEFDGAILENAILTRTDVREATFNEAQLYQIQFSDIRINSQTAFGDECSYETGLHPPKTVENVLPLEAATWVYRRLEKLHEENALADRTSHYHIRKEEAQRKRDRREGNWGRYAVATLNRYLTNHGESIKRLLVAWAVTILGAGLLYPFVGGVEDSGTVYLVDLVAEWPPLASLVGAGEAVARGLYFSIITFTTIGYANVAPHGPWSRVLVGIESLVGAVLIALFVYVLGRRVAR